MPPVEDGGQAGGIAPGPAAGNPPPASKPVVTAVSAALLLAAAVLAFRATGRDRSGSTLGVLVDTSGTPQHLTVGPDGGWTFVPGVLPFGKKSVQLYESAANVLRGGALSPDGSISYQGGSYLIESTFDGKTYTAKVRGA